MPENGRTSPYFSPWRAPSSHRRRRQSEHPRQAAAQPSAKRTATSGCLPQTKVTSGCTRKVILLHNSLGSEYEWLYVREREGKGERVCVCLQTCMHSRVYTGKPRYMWVIETRVGGGEGGGNWCRSLSEVRELLYIVWNSYEVLSESKLH